MRRGHRPSQAPSNRPRFWGRHPVSAALANPARTVRRVWGTREALATFGGFPSDLPVTYAEVADLGRLVPQDAPHQGVVIEVDPLPDIWLGDLLEEGMGNQRPLLKAIHIRRRVVRTYGHWCPPLVAGAAAADAGACPFCSVCWLNCKARMYAVIAQRSSVGICGA